MKAWQLSRYGEPEEVLELADRPRPVPGPGQLLVRVLAASANFPDVLMIRGGYQVKPPLPFVPGVELCGEVAEAGPGVTVFASGDRVLGGAALPDGGFAEYALMDAARAMPVPETLDDAEAAPFHVTYQTGWFGLHRSARLAAGETLLVHAAAGGVGSGAVQLGKAAGATVIGVTGGKEKAAIARELGADVVIDRHEKDFVPSSRRSPAAGAPTSSTTRLAARRTASPPSASRSRAASWSSASRAARSRRRRSTTRW